MHFPACRYFPLSLVPLLFIPGSIAVPPYPVLSIDDSVLDSSNQLRHAAAEDSLQHERLIGTTSALNQRESSDTGKILFEQANRVLDFYVANPKALWIEVQSPVLPTTLHSSAETLDGSYSKDGKKAFSKVVTDIFQLKAISHFKLDDPDRQQMEADFVKQLPEFKEITAKLEQIVTNWHTRLETEPSLLIIQAHAERFHSQFHRAYLDALSQVRNPDMEDLPPQFAQRLQGVRDQLKEIQKWTEQKGNDHILTTLGKVANAAIEDPQLFIRQLYEMIKLK